MSKSPALHDWHITEMFDTPVIRGRDADGRLVTRTLVWLSHWMAGTDQELFRLGDSAGGEWCWVRTEFTRADRVVGRQNAVRTAAGNYLENAKTRAKSPFGIKGVNAGCGAPAS